ncbi:MAG: hypothetical protein HWD61_03250 [Parachlamydiaceae bacterium]|nr:MAG: hypothetical protein HWD61_03250 [Parachlamydiaceae bacterium]
MSYEDFLAIGNILHIRIGTSRLEKQLHVAFKHFPKAPSSSIYYEIIDKAMTAKYLTKSHRSHVLATLEKIYLLSIHQSHFNELTNDQLLIYLTDKIGLRFKNVHLSPFAPFNHLEVQNALNSVKVLMNWQK